MASRSRPTAIIAAGADGKLDIRRPDGSERQTIEVQEMPITTCSFSRHNDDRCCGPRGAVVIINRETGSTLSTLVGPGLPVWSLAFHPDGKTILTGGADRMVCMEHTN